MVGESLRVHFLGASGTVTGSKYVVETAKAKILLDCGLFQGAREWREENWTTPPVDPKSISCVLITHAHIDHIGMLPRYHRLGLTAPIFATASTIALARHLLLDSAHLQEEEARYRGARGRSRHSPPLPLYTADDAASVLKLFREAPLDEAFDCGFGFRATWRSMGHILGACSIRMDFGDRSLLFSGDIGRYSVPILKDPQPQEFGSALFIESTYGDRLHPAESPKVELARIITQTAQRGGVTVIPSFAVGRAQLLLYYLRELKASREIPDIPVIIDSPMAQEATEIYNRSPDDYDHEALQILKRGGHPFDLPKLGFVRDREESMRLNKVDSPMVLISASGMLSGGRILHHLKHRIGDPRNSIVFVGHQPEGGRGAWIMSGAKFVRLLGQDYPINAEIHAISGLSAHGDQSELLRWCRSCSGRPEQVFVVHGEPEAAALFADKLRSEFEWKVSVARYKQIADI